MAVIYGLLSQMDTWDELQSIFEMFCVRCQVSARRQTQLKYSSVNKKKKTKQCNTIMLANSAANKANITEWFAPPKDDGTVQPCFRRHVMGGELDCNKRKLHREERGSEAVLTANAHIETHKHTLPSSAATNTPQANIQLCILLVGFLFHSWHKVFCFILSWLSLFTSQQKKHFDICGCPTETSRNTADGEAPQNILFCKY